MTCSTEFYSAILIYFLLLSHGAVLWSCTVSVTLSLYSVNGLMKLLSIMNIPTKMTTYMYIQVYACKTTYNYNSYIHIL